MKLFYTGPVVNAEMLVMMLEKHGITATQAFVDPTAPDDGDLSRLARFFCARFHSSVRSGIFVEDHPTKIFSPVGAKYAAPDGA
jgi:hypothetical protein